MGLPSKQISASNLPNVAQNRIRPRAHTTVPEVGAGRVRRAQVLERDILNVIDPARQLRGPKNDPRLNLQLQFIAVVERFVCPHKLAVIGPEDFFPLKVRKFLVDLAVVDVLHVGNGEVTVNGKRDKVDRRSIFTREAVTVIRDVEFKDSIIGHYRVGPAVDFDPHFTPHRIAHGDVVRPLKNQLSMRLIRIVG